MKNEELEKLLDGVKNKIGAETTALIADDIATLIVDNTTVNTELTNKETQITKLTNDKQMLMNANMNLLQKTPMGEEPKKMVIKDKEKEEPKKISIYDCYDEKGNFKK